jgi:hypothetical protein
MPYKDIKKRRECSRKSQAKMRKMFPERERIRLRKYSGTGQKRGWLLKSRYGISLKEYDRMFKQQDGGCAICRQGPNGKSLHIDHCHDTGKIRGLLCSNCNTSIGKLRSPALLRSAANYLERIA